MSDQDFEFDEQLHEQRRLRRLELKRKRMIRQRIIYGVFIILLILMIVLIVRGCKAKNSEDATQQEQLEQQQQQQEEQVQSNQPTTVSTATLAAVGDIMVYDTQLDDALEEDGTYNFLPSFAKVASLLTLPDLTIGNFEANCTGAPYSGYPNFNAPESLAKTLSAVGFDIMQTANTYSIQNGVSGLTSTLSHLRDAGLTTVGTYASQAERDENGGIVVKEINGIKFAFLAYTKGVNNMTVPEGSEYCVNLLYTDYDSEYSRINEAGILTSIEAAKELEPDVIVALLHWGSEYDVEISSTQEEITQLMFENGVDVILGSHPHVVGPMEERTVTVNGEEKNVFIAYSLGNFLSNMTEEGTQESVILNLEFTKDNDGKTTISKVDYVPVYIWDYGEEAANRYEIVNIYDALQTETDTDRISVLQDALDHLKTNTQSDYAQPQPDAIQPQS